MFILYSVMILNIRPSPIVFKAPFCSHIPAIQISTNGTWIKMNRKLTIWSEIISVLH